MCPLWNFSAAFNALIIALYSAVFDDTKLKVKIGKKSFIVSIYVITNLSDNI